MNPNGTRVDPGIRLVARCDPDYPSWLGRIYEPPPLLWVRGSLDPQEGERAVAIVGSRARRRWRSPLHGCWPPTSRPRA